MRRRVLQSTAHNIACYPVPRQIDNLRQENINNLTTLRGSTILQKVLQEEIAKRMSAQPRCIRKDLCDEILSLAARTMLYQALEHADAKTMSSCGHTMASELLDDELHALCREQFNAFMQDVVPIW
jgi:hypothetical protein